MLNFRTILKRNVTCEHHYSLFKLELVEVIYISMKNMNIMITLANYKQEGGLHAWHRLLIHV
jgi:hypothetical protein